MKTRNIIIIVLLALLLIACETSTAETSELAPTPEQPTPTVDFVVPPSAEDVFRERGYAEFTGTTVMLSVNNIIDETTWWSLGWTVSGKPQGYADLQVAGPDCTLYPDSSDTTGRWWIGWCDSTIVFVPLYAAAVINVMVMAPDGTWEAASLP